MIIGAVFFFAQLVLSPCVVEGVSGAVHCGTYRVWENRQAESGRQVPLAITVLDAVSQSRKADPLFVLQGGPGDAPSFNARFYDRAFNPIRQTRDIVLVDLRGTGQSNALTCPELSEPDASGVLDDNLLSVEAVRACRERLERIADLRQYTTEIAVDDLDEVRQALGYKQINLYGTSYGTRVAQVFMRRHPRSLRAVVMKGILPPSLAAPETHARAGENAWQKLVQRCKADDECMRNFPTPEDDLRNVFKQLESSPVFPFPLSNTRIKAFKVSPGLFAEAFRFFLYAPDASVRGLKLLHDVVHEGKPGIIENSFASRKLFSGDRLAAGFFLSVTCTEDIPYLPKDLAPLTANTFGGDYRLQQQIRACQVWPRALVSNLHRTPTKSDIPTLILSGELDAVTPPSGGEEVARGLRNGIHVVIKNNGHPIGNAEQCVGQMIDDFLERGSIKGLDTSCAAKIPPVPFRPE
jgi:pimeloyl-ACP methyl ester carboxylesterase